MTETETDEDYDVEADVHVEVTRHDRSITTSTRPGKWLRDESDGYAEAPQEAGAARSRPRAASRCCAPGAAC